MIQADVRLEPCHTLMKHTDVCLGSWLCLYQCMPRIWLSQSLCLSICVSLASWDATTPFLCVQQERGVMNTNEDAISRARHLWLFFVWYYFVLCDMILWCDVTFSFYDMTLSCVTRLFLVWHDSFLCDMTLSCLDSLVCDMSHWFVTRLLHTSHLSLSCDMTHSYMWHDSFIHVTWLIHTCDMTRSYVWHDSFIRVTGPIHMCDIVHSYVWHDPFIFVICRDEEWHRWWEVGGWGRVPFSRI